jgi:hypothetical protein
MAGLSFPPARTAFGRPRYSSSFFSRFLINIYVYGEIVCLSVSDYLKTREVGQKFTGYTLGTFEKRERSRLKGYWVHLKSRSKGH